MMLTASTRLLTVRVWRPTFFVKSPGVWCPPGRPFSTYCPLPQLPVPPLKHTLERYLLALQPLVTPEELEQTREIVREFSRPYSIGSKLQDRLERRSRRTENWLTDWWLQNAYLECRLPLAVHSNPAVVLPKQNYNDWKGQLRFAAKLIAGVLDFKSEVDRQVLPTGSIGVSQKPMDINSYAIPGKCDVLNFIVGEDGSCGVIYEQSSAEGPPIATILDHVLDYCKDPDTIRTPMIPLPLPKKLYFYITPEIKRDIEHAKQNLDILVNDLDISCFTYRNFGKNFPKQHGISPDSFVQMALQLAYFRMYKELCATCESVSLRNFHLGRSDVIRSSSSDSLEFVISMDDPKKEINQKRAALGKAIDCHSAYTDMQALKGLAIDRHLLGLKLQAIEEGLSVPEIFMDTSFAVATHWRLSTGQVAARADCVMCFGPMVPDGYGVWYNPLEDHINFSVSAFNCCEETNAESFSKSLEIALSDMQNLVLQTSGQAA
ncbi:hypothetical protein chiPu_0018137 [Chiloscyllium punctatum]|uniref:Choline/carnitine acyltransferase domain-containing protein n=1 Tax=Chiloscyllium punctatum TaxID=137246 RepID=A0A401RLC5_CHIPU|nr:hypothetical protein [Chiloscyllium punctatum]